MFCSGGSDNLVNLWRIASCSSAPWLGSEDNSNDPPDVRVGKLCTHAFTKCFLSFVPLGRLTSPSRYFAYPLYYVWCSSTSSSQLLICNNQPLYVHITAPPSPPLCDYLCTATAELLLQVRSMDQHEDSVYGVAWSPADAWIYCSLSYDGRYLQYVCLVPCLTVTHNDL